MTDRWETEALPPGGPDAEAELSPPGGDGWDLPRGTLDNGADSRDAGGARGPSASRPRPSPPWFRRVSFRSRLSLIAAAAVGVALALAAFTSYFAVRHQLYNQVDTSLTNEGGDLVDAAGHGLGSGTFYQAIIHLAANDSCAQVVTDTGLVLPALPNRTDEPPPRAAVPGACEATLPANSEVKALAAPEANGDSIVVTESSGGQHYRVWAAGLGATLVPVTNQSTGATTTVPANVALVVYTPLSILDHTLSVLRLILLLVGLGGVALAIALGYLAARAMIRPVERLTAAAEHVAVTQNLDATIDEAGQDELGRLAHSFNAMLGALGASRRQQAQLVADAGHELRTPLTSLRTNVDVLMRVQELPPADRAALLADVDGQLEELTTLVGDLVELAREDEQAPEPVDVGFDGIVQRAVERARRRAGSLQFTVSTEPGLVRGQPALLERAVLNVLDNAIKWSPPGGVIDVRLRQRQDQPGGRWELEVRDHGQGIAPEDIPKVFDRFYRARSARAMPGSGLGLAIVRQVFRSHGGDAVISCPADGGTLVHLELPTANEPGGEPPAHNWPLPEAAAPVDGRSGPAEAPAGASRPPGV